jgi:DNA-binding MarR family transcriptional regulator
VLQRLTASGYVEREANTGDGRSRWVQLTEEGCHVVCTALDASSRAHSEVMADVPGDAARRAADALREILLIVGKRRFR